MPHSAVPTALNLAGLRTKPHVGPIISTVPGRTDDHAMDVPEESFVIPADVISWAGQGNTLAGMKAWMKRLGMPEKAAPRRNAKGIPIMAAGGELVVPPEIVAKQGKGDIKKGHDVLRHAVIAARAAHIKTLKKLPPPAR